MSTGLERLQSHQIAAFIGGGNMGAALVRGLLANDMSPANIYVGEPATDLRERLAAELGVHVSADNARAVDRADVVVVAVKPQDMGATLQPLGHVLQSKCPVVISVAAGIQVADLSRWCGSRVPIIRAMPNRPALHGAGATALFAPVGTPPGARALAAAVAASVGTYAWVEAEREMDAVTALSGSGPAYFLLLTELMIDAAVELGLARATAHELALQTLFGTGQMARASDGDLARLRGAVTSKGGTTEAALQSLESDDLRAIVRRALTAAARRSQELAK
ncbi:MAG: pyrroline-5-carboxylate reductase [Pseudomonadales bacterium]|nr:pyrroline-5-carboxylate reductase [Pseudomonadales bacterium]